MEIEHLLFYPRKARRNIKYFKILKNYWGCKPKQKIKIFVRQDDILIIKENFLENEKNKGVALNKNTKKWSRTLAEVVWDTLNFTKGD